MTKEEAIEQRKKYVTEWNRLMVNIWQDRIMALGVFDTHRRKGHENEPHLYDSLRFFPVTADGEYMELTLSHQFLEYGLYQDFGVGGEKWRGNHGDYLEENPNRPIKGFSTKGTKERERRKWFSTAYYASNMNLIEFMSVSIGREFVGAISDVFEKTEKYN